MNLMQKLFIGVAELFVIQVSTIINFQITTIYEVSTM